MLYSSIPIKAHCIANTNKPCVLLTVAYSLCTTIISILFSESKNGYNDLCSIH